MKPLHILNDNPFFLFYFCFAKYLTLAMPKVLEFWLLRRWRSVGLVIIQISSAAQSCPTLCDPMDCSMPGFPVHHQLPELIQTHVHWVGDAIQSSHPLLSSSPPALSLQMNQFFTSGDQSIGVSASASVLPMSIQDWFPLGLTGWISLQSKGLSRVFSNITVQKHHFFAARLSL